MTEEREKNQRGGSSERLAEVNAELERRTTWDHAVPERLSAAVRHGLLAPGKRLRPMLALWSAELCGGERSNALPAACAVEMIHAYSLIHDDLPAMDNDELRRGAPTVWKQFDEATAILAGDALLTLAFETVGAVKPSDAAARCSVELAKAAGVVGMVGGQADDTRFAALSDEERAKLRTPEFLESIHRRKCGALIVAALRLGALSAGASDAPLAALTRYGEALGLAFQISDDLLDLTGEEKNMGKTVRKDAAAGKLTYPSIFGVEASRDRARREIETACSALDFFPNAPAKTALLEQAASLLERSR